jgi:hypothetical protein
MVVSGIPAGNALVPCRRTTIQAFEPMAEKV